VATAGSEAAVVTGVGEGKGLFLRQSSGLVREVSIIGALFFNVAAFMGPFLPGGLNYALAGEANWKAGLTAYSWAAILVGLAAVAMILIITSFVSVMPKTGGGYVFTSRITHPLLGWLESWGIVWASLALIGFVTVLLVSQIRFVGVTLAIVFPDVAAFKDAGTWLTSTESFFATGIIALVIAGAISLMRPRSFFRIVTWLGGFALAALLLMTVAVMFLVDHNEFVNRLPQYTGGATVDQIIASAALPQGGFQFVPFMVFGVVILGSYIGFQYSAYLAGEVAGSVRRSTLLAVLGALLAAILFNSVINDWVAAKFGQDLMQAYGALLFGGKELPGGLTPFPPILATVAAPGLWPIWVAAMIGTVLFTFLLIPVYIVFISRMFLAWSMDRQAPEWMGAVSERTNTPINATILCTVVGAVILYLSTYQGLALTATLWFTWVSMALTLINPGINALLFRRRRPDLEANAPYRRWLIPLGVVWLIAIGTIYIFGVGRPIIGGLTGPEGDVYFRSSGIFTALVVFAIGLVLYFVIVFWNRRQGIDRSKLYAQVPPD
jgi:APA family basic amino acid/polyamine antiporter